MKKNILLLIICLGLFSCSKTHDLFDTNRVKEESKENFPTQDIDPDHDWNMSGMKTLKVSINQNRGEVYTVKVYTANPLDEQSGAKLMAKKEDVKNGEVISLSFDMPVATTYVYVLLEDEIYNRSVKMADMTEINPSISWGVQNRGARSIVEPSRGVVSYNAPSDADFKTLPNNVKPYPKSWTEKLSGDYFLENCTQALYFINGSYNIYIKGNVSLTGNWPEGMTVYVLEGSTLNVDAGLDFSQANTKLYIAKDAILNTPFIKGKPAGLYNRGKINVDGAGEYVTISTNGYIYNEGDFSLDNGHLKVTDGALFVNLSTLKVLELSITSKGNMVNESSGELTINGLAKMTDGSNILENNGFFKSATLQFTNGTIYNMCRMEVAGFADFNGTTYNQDGETYFEAGSVRLSGTTINLGSKALFYVKSAMEYISNANKITGIGQETALLFVDAVCICGWEAVTYTGNLKIAVKGHQGNNGYFVRDNAEIIALEQVKLGSSNGCGNSYTTDNGGHEGEGDVSQIYTYAFEDITTKGGDYDFNDVVLKVETVPVDNKLKVSLVAAGAQKNLKVYYNAGKSSEKILFGGKELHEALGGAAGEIINTTGQRDKYSPVDDYIPYQEGKSLSEYGDFSIYDMDNRMYVCLPNRYFNDDFNRGDVLYAIMVPTDWYYPDEHQRIDNRYNFFKGWAENKDKYTLWYTQNSWEDSNTYPYDDK